ncbi:KRE11-like protein [Scheffersomyces amazonensis]|uniref:KRE11-like protein n=1 Tax=Scheffersomyces amazonensis TaxID=1078765 RepID=UPI00315DDCF4
MSLSIVIPHRVDRLSSLSSIDKFLFHISSVKNRLLVFYEESITGYIIYKTKDKPRLTPVYLDVTILPADAADNPYDSTYKSTVQIPTDDNSSNGNGDGNHNKLFNNYGVLSKTLQDKDIVFSGISNEDHYIIWKFEVPITYPKKKFSNPNLVLSCFLNEQDLELSDGIITPLKSNETLQNYTPDEDKNILSELNNQILINSLSDTKFSLSKKIIEPISIQQSDELSSTANPDLSMERTSDSIIINNGIRETHKATISIPVSPSLVIKLKSTKPAGRNNLLLATLNIEASDELSKTFTQNELEHYYFKILNVSMDFKFGKVEEIKSQNLSFPIEFKVIDGVNLTYKLINNEYLDTETKSIDVNNNYQFTKPVGIKLTLQVQKYVPEINTMEVVSNIITTSWSPYLDFNIIAPPINNLLKTNTYYSQIQSQPQPQPVQTIPITKNSSTRKSAIMNSLYKLKSPSGNNLYNSNMQLSNSNASLSSINSSKKKNLMGSAASSVTVNLTTNSNSSLSGLKLTFEGKLSIKLGEIINWKIQAINNSSNRLNLSLLVQDPIHFNPVYSSNTTSNNISSSNLINNINNANNTVNKNNEVIVYNKIQLYSLYNSLRINTSGVIILNNDVRIGPLDPNTVFETDIQFIGISKGIFNLDGVKIFDMNSGDGLDFGKLVEVFVV